MAEIGKIKKIGAVMLALLWWVQLTALPPVYAAGNTFYVDAVNGSDANTGLSKQNAWKTAQKVASTVFAAGDTVLFHAGQTFYQAAIVPNCDSLTFGAYGEGERPVLSGGVPCGAWEAYAGSVYRQKIALESVPYLLKIGDKTYRKQTPASYTQTDAGKFSYDEAGKTLYVNEPAGIPADADTQVQQTKHIFYIDRKKNIKIQGLSMMMTGGGAVNIQNAGTENITVDGNEMAYAESYYGSDGGGINCSNAKNSTFSNNIIHDVYGDGIMLWHSSYITVAGNRVWGIKRGNNTGGDGIQSSGKAGNAAPYNKIIDNFVSMKDTDVGKGCIQQENGDNVYIARNVCLYGSFGIEANSNYGTVENNICAYQGTQAAQAAFNWTAGLYMSENEEITGMVWRGNIVSGSRSYGFRFIGSGQNADGSTTVYKRTGFRIYNNTIYSDGPAFSAGVPFDGRVYNNIFYNSKGGKSGAVFVIGRVTDGQSVLSDNNIFYPERSGFISYCGVGYDYLADYQRLTGLELQSYAEDPLLYGTKAGFAEIPTEADFTVYANSRAVSGGRSIKQNTEVVYPVGCNIGAVQTSRTDSYDNGGAPPEEPVEKPAYLPGLLAYDGFDYPPAAALDGLDGGTGFDGPWRKKSAGAASAAVGTSGLRYPQIYVTGYKGLMEMFQERTVAESSRFVNGTYYISFLFQGNAKFQISTPNPDGGQGWIFVQNTAKRTWQMQSSTDTKPKSADACDDTEGMALIRLKVADGKTDAALWVNPNISGGEAGLGAPVLSTSAAARVIPAEISAGQADTSSKIQLDEIRIGSNLEAVLGQTSIYPEAFALPALGLYSGGALIGESVAPGTPVEARLTVTNLPDREREVTVYAAAMADGRLLAVCRETYKISAGAEKRIAFPIVFNGSLPNEYEVSLFVWEEMRPMCNQYGYRVKAAA